MANIQTLLSCLYITFSVLCYNVLDAGVVSFDFPPQTDIQLSGDASIFQDVIQLTMSQVNASMENSVGWAYSSKIIPLWDDHNPSQQPASFSAHLQFIITRFDNGSGDGIAFFLAPVDSQISDADGGEGLGLFNPQNENPSNQIVAVEFDTFKNDQYDPDGNHVGIDVHSIRSKKTFSVKDGALNNGERWDAWIDYNGTVAQLQVFLSQKPDVTSPSKPENPLLVYDIDLSEYLPAFVKVGMSASTGAAKELHALHAWNFSSQYSWDEYFIPSPAPLSSAAPNPTPTPTPTPVPNSGQEAKPNKSSSHSLVKSTGFRIGIIFLCCGLLVVIVLFLVWKRCRRGKGSVDSEETAEILYASNNFSANDGRLESDEELDQRLGRAVQSARKFSYAELYHATNNFSPDEVIGQGGFGRVYRGTLPGTNKDVAVKRISADSDQGKKEYEAEVIVNGKLSHPNVVKLLGWLHQKDDRFLVYEFLYNKSLEKYIFGNPQFPLHWNQRYRVACEIASALLYLHKECPESVVHRDIKASNVMLDSDFRAKLGDFGLARELKTAKEEHTTRPAGTFGNMDPESLRTGKASRESDVYSFGALALAIACGRPPVDNSLRQHESSLVKWVWHMKARQGILHAADKKLDGNFSVEQMERLILVGLSCCLLDPKDRPKMEQVVEMLEMNAELLPLPQALYGDPLPAFGLESGSGGTSDSSTAGISSSSSHVNANL